jgi:hypothetical protein
MSPGVRILERVERQAPFGLRLWDAAAATQRIDGLRVELSPRQRPEQRVRAFVNPSGIWCALGLPGLQTFEHASAADPADWSAALRGYRVEVRDPAGRFLPLAFDADLPVRGLFDPLSAGSPLPGPFPVPESPPSPPGPVPSRVPLFSAPGRPVPSALAEVRAQVLEHPSGRPAAWCLIAVSLDGVTRGLGLADQEGRVLILFPYPARPRPVLTSPPSPTNDFRWTLTLTAYYRPGPLDAAVSAIPDLADLQEQFAAPRKLFASLLPDQHLTDLPLEYQVPLTVRTRTTGAAGSSYLFVEAT